MSFPRWLGPCFCFESLGSEENAIKTIISGEHALLYPPSRTPSDPDTDYVRPLRCLTQTPNILKPLDFQSRGDPGEVAL